MDSPILWYLNRATGVVLLVLFTLVVVLGILSTRNPRRRGIPRFVTQGLHRNLAYVASALLVGHVASAVVDTYVDIRWTQAVLPWGATYKPLWLSLGTVALDLMAVVVFSSVLRVRTGVRVWRSLHVLAYVAWAAAVVHGVGIGTDAHARWSVMVTVTCIGVVSLAVTLRTGALLLHREPTEEPA